MSPQEQQSNLQAEINDISPEALAKIQAAKGDSVGGTFVDTEWLLIARMGKHYGWAAIEAILPEVKDGLSGEYMNSLLVAGDKIDAKADYCNHRASFVGAASAQSNSPSKTFESMTKHLLKQAEADE